jgi:hypothetical protein
MASEEINEVVQDEVNGEVEAKEEPRDEEIVESESHPRQRSS